MFGVDIVNDIRDKIFWNITNDKKVLIDNQMFEYLGYCGSYHQKKQSLTKLLKKPHNNYIPFEEITDEHDPRKKYYVLQGKYFDDIIMQMRTSKVAELRQLFSLLKNILVKQCEYETLYGRHIQSQNNVLLRSVDELKSLVVTVKTSAEEERQRAEERERSAHRERQCAEEERRRAEERNKSMKQQMKRNESVLTNIIAPRMAPLPIGKNKTRKLGLYKTSVCGEWYLMRRQQEGWREAERKLFTRNMVAVQTWDNVPHAVDIGNLVKKHYRQFNWFARGNHIRSAEMGSLPNANEEIVKIITECVNKENEAHYLARENKYF